MNKDHGKEHQAPCLSEKEKKEQRAILEALVEWENLSAEQQKERIKASNLRNKNRFQWYKVSPDTKVTIWANGALSLLLILITSITVVQQCSTNNLQKRSISVMLKQDSTNQENLQLMKEEFELNFRPYVSSVAHHFYNDSDSIMAIFTSKNLGNVQCVINDSIWAYYDNDWQFWDKKVPNSSVALFPGSQVYHIRYRPQLTSTVDSILTKISYSSPQNNNIYSTINIYSVEGKQLLISKNIVK